MGADAMLNRAVISFAVLWAFLALPSLCGAGLLPHACQQHASNDCGHERGCNDDPCAKFTSAGVPSASRADSLDTCQPVAMPVFDALSACDPLAPHRVPTLQPPRAFVPAPGDRLPLLI